MLLCSHCKFEGREIVVFQACRQGYKFWAAAKVLEYRSPHGFNLMTRNPFSCSFHTFPRYKSLLRRSHMLKGFNNIIGSRHQNNYTHDRDTFASKLSPTRNELTMTSNWLKCSVLVYAYVACV